MNPINGVIVEEDSVTIYENGVEIVHWVIDEIAEDAAVALSIANAIRIYYEEGVTALKNRIK